MAHTFTVVKTETCPFCTQAMGFLTRLHEARGDFSVKVIDANASPAKARQIFQQVGRNTVPQIFLDREYIGGWTELSKAAGNGKLDAFLNGEEWTPPAEPEKRPRFAFWRRASSRRPATTPEGTDGERPITG